MADTAVTIIGAGVVGLAIGAEISRRYAPVYIIERNPKYGQETSSRNSEVIHAGLYYPRGSLKTKLCIEGRIRLYEMCEKSGIPHRRITKIITAATERELPELQHLYEHGCANGVELKMLSAAEVHRMEPNIASAGGIYSPTTGIISAHALMDYFYHTGKNNGVELQTRCTVVGLERTAAGYTITVDEGTARSSFTSERVINAAGLESDTVASLAGIDVVQAEYRIHFCKGSYFSLSGPKSRLVTRLVYPVPRPDTLGVHALMDLAGRVKFGPDIEYLPDRTLDYSVDESKRHAFAESVRRIMPSVQDEDLTPDMSGMRAKLQARGQPVRDFVIRHEADRGLPGLINIIGIESPGLTSSPAIARYVLELLDAM